MIRINGLRFSPVDHDITELPLQTSKSIQSLLLTGFGSFPGVARNCSYDLAIAVAETLGRTHVSAGTAEVIVNTAKLDVDWQTIAPNLTALYQRHQPNLAIHFGVCRTVTGLMVERTAHNATALDPDTAGHVPKMATVCNDPALTRCTRLPVDALATHLSGAGIDVTVSDDAGRYLCNAAYYLSLKEAGLRSSPADALFVHIPADLTPSSPRWSPFVDRATDLVRNTLNAQQAQPAS